MIGSAAHTIGLDWVVKAGLVWMRLAIRIWLARRNRSLPQGRGRWFTTRYYEVVAEFLVSTES